MLTNDKFSIHDSSFIRNNFIAMQHKQQHQYSAPPKKSKNNFQEPTILFSVYFGYSSISSSHSPYHMCIENIIHIRLSQPKYSTRALNSHFTKYSGIKKKTCWLLLKRERECDVLFQHGKSHVYSHEYALVCLIFVYFCVYFWMDWVLKVI